MQLPQLHESLLIANERLVDRARRRARLFRMGALSSVAAVSVGGAAVAGQALWGPVLGHEDGNRPSASATPVPTEQRSLLGVLRREQTPADRGAAARGALAATTRQYRGVRLADVRLLHEEAAGEALVLIPVAGLAAVPGVTSGGADVLCLATGRRGDASTSTCHSADDLRHGRVTGVVGDAAWGVVPDGVVAVAVRLADGERREVPVVDNAFTTTGEALDPRRRDALWLGPNGREILPEGAQPMRLPLVESPGAIRPGYRDCGPAEGGVVPRSVACGEDARRWTPPVGEDGSGRDPGARPTP